MISWITDNIAIGEYIDANNLEALIKEKIDCVFSLCYQSDAYEQSKQGIKFFHLKVGDHQGKEVINVEFKVAVYMLELLLENYDKVLIHCMAGLDRAPFIIAKYLVEKYDYTYEEAYKLIKEKRPFILEHYEWVE